MQSTIFGTAFDLYLHKFFDHFHNTIIFQKIIMFSYYEILFWWNMLLSFGIIIWCIGTITAEVLHMFVETKLMDKKVKNCSIKEPKLVLTCTRWPRNDALICDIHSIINDHYQKIQHGKVVSCVEQSKGNCWKIIRGSRHWPIHWQTSHDDEMIVKMKIMARVDVNHLTYYLSRIGKNTVVLENDCLWDLVPKSKLCVWLISGHNNKVQAQKSKQKILFGANQIVVFDHVPQKLIFSFIARATSCLVIGRMSNAMATKIDNGVMICHNNEWNKLYHARNKYDLSIPTKI